MGHGCRTNTYSRTRLFWIDLEFRSPQALANFDSDDCWDMEHRWGKRHSVDLEVSVRSHGGTVTSGGRLSDVSLSGGFLSTELPVLLLSQVSIRIVGERGRMGAALNGQVVRRSTNGFGIEWSEFAPRPIRNLLKSSSLDDRPIAPEHEIAATR